MIHPITMISPTMFRQRPLRVAELLVQARENRDRLNELFGIYRPYLRLEAARDQRLKLLCHKLDASDIVQNALKRANRSFDQFVGASEPEFTAWLSVILSNTIVDAVRHFRGKGRDVSREQPLGGQTKSARILIYDPMADVTSASHRLIEGENALRLAQILDELPKTWSQALRMRYLEGQTIKAIAERMRKSELAVAGYLKRGLKSLRNKLPKEFNSKLV